MALLPGMRCMINLYKAIAVFLILLLGILAKDKGGMATFVVSVLVASAVFLSPDRYAGPLAGKKRWVVGVGVLVLLVMFVVEMNLAQST